MRIARKTQYYCLFRVKSDSSEHMGDTSLRYFTQTLRRISEFEISEVDCLGAAGLSAAPTSERVDAVHTIKTHLIGF